jgi:hypothetical protein
MTDHDPTDHPLARLDAPTWRELLVKRGVIVPAARVQARATFDFASLGYTVFRLRAEGGES